MFPTDRNDARCPDQQGAPERADRRADSLSNLTESTQSPRVAVIGDIMIDVDLDCRCERICQDGPWPVFSIEATRRRLGGAGNVAAMLLALECDVLMMGLVGRDDVAPIPTTAAEIGWRVVDGMTTTKTRLWWHDRLMGPRIDQDQDRQPTNDDLQYFLQRINEFAPEMILVADHGKGAITLDLMRELGRVNIPLLVDPIFTTPFPFSPTAIAGGTQELGPDALHAEVLIEKRGAAGLVWTCHPHCGNSVTLPSTCRNVIDPLGAGDQFLASLACQRCLGADWPEAIHWANVAAGLQCEQPGCVPLQKREIDAAAHFPTDPVSVES